MLRDRRVSPGRDDAEALAVSALAFLAATGIGPAEIRAAARQPGFLAGVLEYIASDERLAAAFTRDAGCQPADLAKAHAALGGEPWEREVP